MSVARRLSRTRRSSFGRVLSRRGRVFLLFYFCDSGTKPHDQLTNQIFPTVTCPVLSDINSDFCSTTVIDLLIAFNVFEQNRQVYFNPLQLLCRSNLNGICVTCFAGGR